MRDETDWERRCREAMAPNRLHMTFNPESDNPRTVEEYRLWRGHRDAHGSFPISPNWRRVFALDNRATLSSCDLYPCSDIAGLTDRPKDRQGPGLTPT